jgi:hypothetical protein
VATKAPVAAKEPVAKKAPARGGPTVAELRARAKATGITGYSSMTKAQLIEVLG